MCLISISSRPYQAVHALIDGDKQFALCAFCGLTAVGCR
jgi:hypothetical protein